MAITNVEEIMLKKPAQINKMLKKDLVEAINVLISHIVKMNDSIKEFDEDDLLNKITKLETEISDLENDKYELESELEDVRGELDRAYEKNEKYEQYETEYLNAREAMINGENYLSDSLALREMFTEFENKIGRSHF